jgi:hypothetical protein
VTLIINFFIVMGILTIPCPCCVALVESKFIFFANAAGSLGAGEQKPSIQSKG